MGCSRAAAVWLAIVVAAGCNRLFGIDQIPYAGPVDAAAGSSGSGLDADLGPLDLTVEMMGTLGTVADNQMKLDCMGVGGTECQQDYPSGTQVKLTPSATPPAEFAVWGGACLDQNGNTPPSCLLTTGGTLTVTADFVESGSDVLNLIPSSSNEAVGVANAYISVDGVQCQSGSACTYLFPNNTINESLIGNSTTCALLQTLTGPGCTLPPDCTVTFSGGTKIITVQYAFMLEDGSDCSE